MSETVEPRLSRGLRDLLPDQMLARQSMVDTIRHVCELYGFVPLTTPAIEYLDVLSGAVGSEQYGIFRVTNPENEALGLRFDLTVPLARVIAQYPDLPRPFRRYQVSPVWRADKPGAGRYREFTQFDFDSVGVESEIADTEILAAIADTLDALEVGPYLVSFSSRAILNLLLDFASVSHDRATDVFRVLDKLDHVGIEKVRLELMDGYRNESGDVIRGLELKHEQVVRIGRFLAIGGNRRDVILQLRDLFEDLPHGAPQIDIVERISEHLYALGYGDDKVALDLSIARGLIYYTGPVFEATLMDAPQFGAVFGGGRYDNLLRRFLGEAVPAVGASIGVDRLLAALTHVGRKDMRKATARVLVTSMDPALMPDYLAMTWELRRAGIPTELYVGMAKGLGKQLKYADQYEIPLVILYGSDEKQQGVITVKDMAVGRARSGQLGDRTAWITQHPGQRNIPRADLVLGIRAMLVEVDSWREL
jgi:histidyl-tRNA synthetase